MSSAFLPHPASYRDPSGFVFTRDGVVYRQVNQSYREDYDRFLNSGCYASLVQKGWLLPHTEIPDNLTGTETWYKTLVPEKIDLVTYPYEWSFDMLKDAALLTLQICQEALRHDLILKDATAYNVQWHGGKLVFIDTLSFERYDEKAPWVAYRQFCEQFLSPLLLMKYQRQPLHELMLAYPDGIPVGLTSKWLPAKSRLSLFTYLHIHLHAKISARPGGSKNTSAGFSRKKMEQLLRSLENLVAGTELKPLASTWSAYYEEASRREGYQDAKKALIGQWLEELTGLVTATDLGANDGEYSKILANKGYRTVSADADALCINNLYRQMKSGNVPMIQPMVIDLAKPSPANGLNLAERASFTDRLHSDLVLALALIHHLAIGKNIPLHLVAGLLQQVTGHYLIIEFIPKTDEKIQLMLRDRKDIYLHYDQEHFEQAFRMHFTIESRKEIGQSGRWLYLLKKNEE